MRSERQPRAHSGIAGQGARFALTGGAVTAFYLLATTFLASVAGLPFQLALAIGFGLSLTIHFTLQRVFVWAHHEEFVLPIHHQVARYLLVTGAQYGVTAASVALLPAALGLPTEVVYVGTVALAASANFLLFRNSVFHTAAAGVKPA